MAETVFSLLPDDVILHIFLYLQDDPRHWARLACVCTKFSSFIRNFCCKIKCSHTIPSVVSDLLFDSSVPPGGWASLQKLAVCCPGLLHAGVPLESSDFGLEREFGQDEGYQRSPSPHAITPSQEIFTNRSNGSSDVGASGSNSHWSLCDYLYNDTVYNASESKDGPEPQLFEEAGKGAVKVDREFSSCKRRKICISLRSRSHLASGIWNLSREQGNKLLARQFRDDCLYICDWPGCLHSEEKRNYMLFRGIFKNFRRTRVWRTINDGNRKKIALCCAFCQCKETWDLHSAFCLRRFFGFHDDGEPVVRAYVCENGHVSGAWTDLPLYA
ncbi:phytochrome A-associated F-box protein-like [Neltuma alba]|uniref:phytochrome A-associated F-box protein-like n=1 Tax=Neltuma alba TaxID=207710 RepID=UPI0010A49F3A|nr:phytochrome A-associated F-box protein-like [Prosopis alba]XP_028804140.1 phytochrome A-associated F-box protein-like [Prosopis alba]